MCITERERALHHHFPLKHEYALSSNHWEGHGRVQRWAQTHLQEVILNVAIEGAAQAQSVVFPQLAGLQVEAKLCPAVLQTQAEHRLHLKEHGRQLLDVEEVCGRDEMRTLRFRCNKNTHFHRKKSL